MDNKPIKSGLSPFEQARKFDENGNEYWTAREMAKILGYSEYRHFLPVIEKAKKACENSGHLIEDHFEDILEMIEIGKGGHREVESVKLSRYACYLIIQNADPSKEIVALGQTYFAVQTRKQELFEQMSEDEKRVMLRDEIKEHNKALAAAAKDAGVETSLDFAIFQNHGYKGLYGGLGVKELKQRRNLGKSQDVLDHMGSTELAANLFRATQTEEKLRRENIKGKTKANLTHYEVGRKVRQTIKELGGTMPEDLPVVENIKHVRKRLKLKKPKQIKGSRKGE